MASHRGKQLWSTFGAVLFVWLIAVATPGAAVAEEPLAERLQRSAEFLQRLSQDANQGNPVSQYSLGLRYLVGDGVPQDYAEAATWFHHAADRWPPVAHAMRSSRLIPRILQMAWKGISPTNANAISRPRSRSTKPNTNATERTIQNRML
jgi:hypothetical protein